MNAVTFPASIYFIILMIAFVFSSCCYEYLGGYDTHRNVKWHHKKNDVIIVRLRS